MFTTRQEAYIELSGLNAEGLHWRYVEHSLHSPWFYITLTRYSEGASFQTMLQTMDPNVLATVICSSSHDLSVKDVMLVTPPFINGTECWLMENLLEFSQCHNEKYGSFDYFLVAGGHYYTPQPASDPTKLKLETCIFYQKS
jgi:hypothetical protein